jgi:hypothetical protein
MCSILGGDDETAVLDCSFLQQVPYALCSVHEVDASLRFVIGLEIDLP